MDTNDNISLNMGDYMGNQQTLIWEDTPDCTTYLHNEGDTIRIERRWKNIGALLESNMRAANEFHKSQGMKDFQHMATIPLGLFYEWSKDGSIDDDVTMARRLNDADFAKFRVNSWKL